MSENINSEHGEIDKSQFQIIVGYKPCRKYEGCDDHPYCGAGSAVYKTIQLDVDEAIQVLGDHISQRIIEKVADPKRN